MNKLLIEPTFHSELSSCLSTAINSYRGNPRDIEMLISHYYDGKKHTEIAKEYKVSTSLVGFCIKRILRAMRHPDRVKIISVFWDGKDPARLRSNIPEYGA